MRQARLWAFSTFLAAAVFAAAPTPERPTVSVTGGPVEGTLLAGGGAVFKGIPYAQPPVGDLRWRAPQPVSPWAEVRDATRFGAICPQNPSSTVPNAAEISSEDCLSLNVWAPEWPVARARPVLLWIPGGGNVIGGTSELRHDGARLARRGIVVVTINYRLGSLGFFAHPDLGREAARGASGNQALRDQLAAVEWVHANIARFGGDPDALTLGGVSAGAIDIAALMTSPLAAGRFKRAILQSGPSRGVFADPLPPPAAEQQSLRHATAWGASPTASLRDLRAIPAARILGIQSQRTIPQLNLSIDGEVLTAAPADVFASGRQHGVPILMGSSARDFLPGAQPPTGLDALIAQAYGPLASRARALYASADPLYGTPEVQWATDTSFRCNSVLQMTQHVAGGHTAFAYEFARLTTPDIQPGGNIHGLDSAFSLGTFASRSLGTKLVPIEHTAADTALSEQMQQYWTNFVKTGDPNGPGLPAWPVFREPARAYLQLAETGPAAREGLRRAQCDLYIENMNRLRLDRAAASGPRPHPDVTRTEPRSP
jgi:para-nitrobenzyl esterase